MAAVNRYACGLGPIQLDIHPGPLKIKRKATHPMPLHQSCQPTPLNFIRQDCCYIVNATYTPAGRVPFLVESC